MYTNKSWFSEGKNCAMSNARTDVTCLEAHAVRTRWVRETAASSTDLWRIPPVWHGWMAPEERPSNWSRFAIIFSMSLPNVLRRTIGLYDLAFSYDGLPGLGIMTDTDCLKCDGHLENLMHPFASLRMTYGTSA